MRENVKFEIHKLIDSIEDETVLQMLAEDIAYYASKKDIVDDLNKDQQQELNEAIAEANNGETIDWKNFKNEMNEWKKR